MTNCNCGDTIYMHAGTSSDFCFHLFYRNGQPLTDRDITAEFTLSHYSDLYMEPIMVKVGRLIFNDVTGALSSVLVNILPHETADFQTGKYVYKLKITDRDGGVDMPSHGFLFIRRI